MFACRWGRSNQRHQNLATLDEARRLIDTDPRRAVVLARRLLAANPANDAAALILGAASRRNGDLATAMKVLSALARKQPNAWGVFYELGLTQDAVGDSAGAAVTLSRAISLNPQSSLARHAWATSLYKSDQPEEALAAIGPLMDAAPANLAFRSLRAAVLMQLDKADDALADYTILLEIDAASAPIWHSCGHAFKAIGSVAEAVSAYRQAIFLDPRLGEAWWSLANLKTWRFTSADIAAMESAIAVDADSAWLNFALAKALEDTGAYAEAFSHYATGNAIRRQATPHDAAAASSLVLRTMEAFTPALFAKRSNVGAPDPDPIFIIGMPRSGSTLVEQILASHSAVEGASELPDIPAIARRLATSAAAVGQTYPAYLASLAPQHFAELGIEYLEHTRIRRPLLRPRFVDKFPGNFLHVGLIHLMLPNARIIDVRRDPLACCFSLFKQAFTAGQFYSYDLEHLGRSYAEYVALMTHFETIIPNRILHLSYDALVEDTAAQTERLLAHCGLSFEPGCLRFFETQRTIRTPSAQQVRQPIFRESLDQWRNFEPWLAPLKAALGPLADPS